MKKTLQVLLIICILTTSILTGSCDEDDDTIITELLQVWTLQSFGKIGDEQSLIQGTEITLEFDDEHKVRGNACNYYFGTYEAKNDGTISFKQLAMTEMACLSPEGIMKQETQYFEALSNVSAYEVEQDQLRLFYGEGQSVLNFAIKTEDHEKKQHNGNS
jgi:heat shock protein HslJ